MVARSPLVTRLPSIITILTLLVMQCGCVSRRFPTVPLHAKLRTQNVALVSRPVEIDISPDLYARGRLAGGFKGAAMGPVKFMANSGSGSCSGSICGAAFLLWMGLAVTVGPVIGATEGVKRATPADEADRLEQDLGKAIGLVATHLDLSRCVLETAQKIPDIHVEQVSLVEPSATMTPDYRALRKSGYGAILEVTLQDIHFQAEENQGALLRLHLKASARVIDPETQDVIYENEFTQTSPAADWSKEKGNAVLQALDRNIQGLAQSIVSNVFESVSLPLLSNFWAFPGTRNFGWCWLKPIDPPAEVDHPFPFKTPPRLRSPVVSSRHPTLTFSPFPDEEQAEQLYQGLGSRIDGVTYGIRVWQPLSNGAVRLVYERHGLSRPSHTLEQSLESETEYFWSMRACFPYNKINVCTLWAYSSRIPVLSCYETTIPLRNYFRFKTPATGFE